MLESVNRNKFNNDLEKASQQNSFGYCFFSGIQMLLIFILRNILLEMYRIFFRWLI